MKAKLYLCIIMLLLGAFNSKAQYHITGHVWVHDTSSIGLDTGCGSPYLKITTDAYASGLSIKSFFENGDTYTTTIRNGGGYGYAYCPSNFPLSGTYTNKEVLYNSTAPIDSMTVFTEYNTCQTFIIKSFNDVAGTCLFDSSTDSYTTLPMLVEVSENGVAFDTISLISGYYYTASAPINTIFSFKIISTFTGTGITLTCPSSGVIYDTVTANDTIQRPKYFGFQCLSGYTGFDLGLNRVNYYTRGGHQHSHIYAYNSSCNSVVDASITVYFSPKYVYTGEAYPLPTSTSGNSLTWVIPGFSFFTPASLDYRVEENPATGPLTMGDTVRSYYTITPTLGDIDTLNNSEMVIDTVTSSSDPNEMSVTPSGNITAGTKLQYTIGFENTGNDTAFNISVYDTLSDNVDVKSLNMLMASSAMNIATLNWAGHNIVKFDFPNINLLDSSHHGQCDGAVIFTVNTKSGLPDGTTIFNHAGIFFDYNPVVMTDTVEDIIGTPTNTALVNNSSNVSVYPNPSHDEVIISADNSIYTLAVFTNVLGQQMRSVPLTASRTSVNLSNLPDGMYYITLKGDRNVRVIKFEKM